jgi:uncharacterized membrane protein
LLYVDSPFTIIVGELDRHRASDAFSCFLPRKEPRSFPSLGSEGHGAVIIGRGSKALTVANLKSTTQDECCEPTLGSVPVVFSGNLYSTESLAKPSRLASVDLLRGIAMILMALDHTRDFFSGVTFAPEDLAHTTGPLFFTRFITHFCAPAFFLLAGTAGYLSLSRGKSIEQVSRFFWTRGLWLVFLNLTVVAFGWTSVFPFLFSDVLWSLGWSMVAMAFLIRLPIRWIATFGVLVIVGHNLLDRVKPSIFGNFTWLWLILYGHASFWIQAHGIGPTKIWLWFFVLFPIIPWVGVMAAGYALGPLIQPHFKRGSIFVIGATATLIFLIFRGFHLYGNSHRHIFGPGAGRWRVEPTLTLTIVSFFDTLKYPASFQFLLMTLGPALIALACLACVKPEKWPARAVRIYGQVPLFYYIVHIYVIRTLAVYTALICKQKVAWLLYGGFMLQPIPKGYGHSLPFIYVMWFAVVLCMYPLCKWYMGIKQTHPTWWWLRYL